MKNKGTSRGQILKYIILAVFLALISYGVAVLGMAGMFLIKSAHVKIYGLRGWILLICVFIMGFALPITGIVGIRFSKYLRKKIRIFIPVSILDALICFFSTEWLSNNLLYHGSEYTWWGFQIIWYGKILIINGIFLLIMLLICSIKSDIKVDAVKSTEGEEI